MTWGGEERRATGREDHDSLIQMIALLRNHVDNFNTHREDDNKKFSLLFGKVDKLGWLLGIGTGIIVTLQFTSRYFLK